MSPPGDRREPPADTKCPPAAQQASEARLSYIKTLGFFVCLSELIEELTSRRDMKIGVKLYDYD